MAISVHCAPSIIRAGCASRRASQLSRLTTTSSAALSHYLLHKVFSPLRNAALPISPTNALRARETTHHLLAWTPDGNLRLQRIDEYC